MDFQTHSLRLTITKSGIPALVFCEEAQLPNPPSRTRMLAKKKQLLKTTFVLVFCLIRNKLSEEQAELTVSVMIEI